MNTKTNFKAMGRSPNHNERGVCKPTASQRVKLRTNIILTASLSVLVETASLEPQNLTEMANIPFAFHAQHQTLATGKCQVAELNSGSVFELPDAKGASINVGAPVLAAHNPRKPHLTFARYGTE